MIPARVFCTSTNWANSVSSLLIVVLIKKCSIDNYSQLLFQHDPGLFGIKNAAALPFGRQANNKAQTNRIVIKQNTVLTSIFWLRAMVLKRTAAVFTAILAAQTGLSLTKASD